jgi:hypothetical protein
MRRIHGKSCNWRSADSHRPSRVKTSGESEPRDSSRATKNFYYGVNFEFSWNEPQWGAETNTGEIRPSIGWRFGDGWSFTVNPILNCTTRASTA